MGIREIIFRGKTLNNEWVQGAYYHQTEFYGDDFEGHYIITTTDELEDNMMNVCMVIPETVGQYTGLTDKNGKKIFEGDYWLDTDGDYIVFVVEFRDGQFCFVSYGQSGALMPYGFDEDAGCFDELDCEPMTDFIIENIEIDGNIYDNPDVLKDEIPEELAEILWSE